MFIFFLILSLILIPFSQSFDFLHEGQIGRIVRFLPEPTEAVLNDISSLFKGFKKTFNKHYKDESEEQMRSRIFEENVKEVVEYNKKNKASSQGLNQFSDRTEQELKKTFPQYDPAKMDEMREGELAYKKDPEYQRIREKLKKRKNRQNTTAETMENDDDQDEEQEPIRLQPKPPSSSSSSKGLSYFEEVVGPKNKKGKEPLILPGLPIVSNVLNVASGGAIASTVGTRKYSKKHVNWAAKGATSSISNQGECNSCWSFAATATIEAQMYRKTKNMTKLAEQMLVDCFGGCAYNNVPNTFNFIMKKGGIPSETTYGAYNTKRGKCRFESGMPVAARILDFHTIPRLNEGAIADVIEKIGPVTAWIKITKSLLMHSKGVYTLPECDIPLSVLGTHIVPIIGFGREEGVDYWLIKNSWGEYWGEGGLGKILRNSNMCGLAEFNYYPEVEVVSEDDDDDDDENTTTTTEPPEPEELEEPKPTTPQHAPKNKKGLLSLLRLF